jgi:protein-glutamine gamma-glutamyltransferase
VRFRAIHKLMSYLLAAAAVATLLTSGAVPLPTLTLLLVVSVLSWFVEPGTRMGQLLDRGGLVFSIVALAFFALSLYHVIQSFPEQLTPILNLVLFLLGYKLFHRRNNRDYLQIYILSFLLVLAAAWLAQTVLFVVGFAVYVVLATWTLILFHLRREIEDNYLVKHLPQTGTEKVTAARVLNSRRVVGRPFFLTTGLLALGVFVGAAAVFAAIPRIGPGFLSGSFRRRVSIVGFSDEVTLGHHGVISGDNQTVVLWVKMPRLASLPDEKTRDHVISQLYWRGTVYDTYYLVHDNPRGPPSSKWGRANRKQTETLLDEAIAPNGADKIWWVGSPEAPPERRRGRSMATLERYDEQEIQMVGLSDAVAFALDEPIAFRTPPPPLGSFVNTEVYSRYSGEVALRLTRVMSGGQTKALKEFTGARYFAYSRNPMLRAATGEGRPMAELLEEGQLDSYLTVPASLLGQVTSLAHAITEGKTTPMAKAQAVVQWLQKTHRYTTELKRNPQVADPLEDFLFHQTAGHCEYFASAAAILLRLAGVPTRYVNGFLGGEWNNLGKYLTVRDNRAHSWVEAYMGPAGWVRVDATPSVGAPSHMGRLLQVFDSLEFFWSRWVIDYDASRQIDLARRIGDRIGVGTKSFEGRLWPVGAGRWVVAGLAALVLLLLLARSLRVRLRRSGTAALRRTRRGGPAIVRLYERALVRLAKTGWVRQPNETPREFAARLQAAQVAGADAMTRLSEHYGASRYGGHPVPEEILPDLERALGELGGEIGRPGSPGHAGHPPL